MTENLHEENPEKKIDDDWEDDWEDDGDYFDVYKDLQDSLVQLCKEAITELYSDKVSDFEPEVFRTLEQQLPEHAMMVSEMIPDILFNHRSIKDENEFDKAMDAFIANRPEVKWRISDKVPIYIREIEEREEDDPEALENMPEEARKVIEIVNQIQDNEIEFSGFMKDFCNYVIPRYHDHLMGICSFDLYILTDEGWEELNNHIDMFVSEIANYVVEYINDMP